MAKYIATPGYTVAIDEEKTVRFGYHGDYETDDAAEITILDGLAPTWITKVDDGSKPEEPKAEPEPKAAPKPAPATQSRSRRTSGK